jgi:hypothetical protein
MQITDDLVRRFNAMWMPVPWSGCWLWLGAIKTGHRQVGHGVIGIGGGRANGLIRAHRLSYLIHKGEIPDGILVRHTCDIACCVNPDHLILGTMDDNVRDMMERGRGRGQFKPQVSADVVIAIRQDTRSEREMGEAYGISAALAGMIRRGRRGHHVDAP